MKRKLENNHNVRLNDSKTEIKNIQDDTFQIIFDQSPVSTQIFSPDGTLIKANKAWEKLWGVKLKNIQGYNILKDKQLVAKKIMPLIKKAFKGQTVHLSPVRYEPNKTIKDVSKIEYRWTQSIIYAIKDTNGKVLKVILQHEDISDKKKSEDDLKVHYKVLESMIEGVSISDENGIIVYTNASEDAMFGYKRGELIGKHVSIQNAYALEENKRIVNDVIKQLNKKGYWSGEWNNKKKDGTHFVTTSRITAIEIDGKKHWVCVQEDITSRKEAVEALRNERHRIYTLFMQAPAMIGVIKGSDFVFELANPLYLKSVGKTKDIIGKKLLEGLPELKGQPIVDVLKHVYTTGESFLGKEVQIKLDINGDGIAEDVYFNFVYQATHDARGNIDGIMTHAIDVTPQVEARKKIEETEKRFRDLADNIPNLTWMANADGYIFWYNSKWYEYTGTTPKGMEGWGWKSVHHPDALPRVLKQWKSSIEHGSPFNMVFPIKGADGKFRPFLTRVNPIKNEVGEVVRWFGANTDITEQKELEEQKDEFLAIASHELKTPVTSIKAYGQVLQRLFEREGNTKAVSQLSKMDAQINKLTTLIADLLNVTKIHSGRLVMQDENFDFNELANEVINELQLTTDRHNLIMELSQSTTMHGDRERTGQVITNLISNAIKYSPHSKKIIVKTEVDKDYITLCVQDFGVGIPKDKQDRVFEQFFRVSGEKQHTFPGLGLGLYISSEIIKRQGGKIWVESIIGKGSTFCFKLPRKRLKHK
ncbi:MAG: PAS domain-containing sensor histidine kinase [Candidatus Levybacteria bacterium]|nr:PAS domain-containing sensor histidine kinase [Candidatus Levybacteria bacterium]